MTARRSERIKGGSEATEATIQPKCRAGTRYFGHRPRNSLAGVADRLTEAGLIGCVLPAYCLGGVFSETRLPLGGEFSET